MNRLRVWTDGSSSGRSESAGGWAWIAEDMRRDSGGNIRTTNQRMEMTAALRAIETLADEAPLHILSDSQYVVNCFNQRWHAKWKDNGWRNSANKPVSNSDIWEELIEIALWYQVKFQWVRGHNGDVMNDRADRLARSARVQMERECEPEI